jgi:acetolactate synthase I/II/III large subunit
MNGALSLLQTLQANGVDVVFANPGTSEMHFVAALDGAPGVRGVLGLFEGVVTGAADGYARVTGRPAATLLHLGPGLGNGWANLHNARRARVPLVNIVGDHATYHSRFDAPLESDLFGLARTVSTFVRRSARPDDVAGDAADAIRAAYGPPAQIATLLLPADASWGALTQDFRAPVVDRPIAPRASDEAVAATRGLLRQEGTVLFLGGDALSRAGLAMAHRLAAATGVRVVSETFPTTQARGCDVFTPERTIYLAEFAAAQLATAHHVVLVSSIAPVSFFAYPDLPSTILSPHTAVSTLTRPGDDAVEALTRLVEEIGAPPVTLPERAVTDDPTGPLTTHTLAAAVAATLPADTILVDESNTCGMHLYGALSGAAPHDLLTLTGGSIGYGLPNSLGAAIGGGGRRVLAIVADGSFMYTPQALWSMAREGLDVTVLVLSNRSYAILNLELERVGATADGAASRRMLDLDTPTLDLAALARAQGVDAVTVHTTDDLVAALRRSYATPGPQVIEAWLPKGLS